MNIYVYKWSIHFNVRYIVNHRILTLVTLSRDGKSVRISSTRFHLQRSIYKVPSVMCTYKGQQSNL
jgi:hypothetical protein